MEPADPTTTPDHSPATAVLTGIPHQPGPADWDDHDESHVIRGYD